VPRRMTSPPTVVRLRMHLHLQPRNKRQRQCMYGLEGSYVALITLKVLISPPFPARSLLTCWWVASFSPHTVSKARVWHWSLLRCWSVLHFLLDHSWGVDRSTMKWQGTLFGYLCDR
jgi:hypothetical protein